MNNKALVLISVIVIKFESFKVFGDVIRRNYLNEYSGNYSRGYGYYDDGIFDVHVIFDDGGILDDEGIFDDESFGCYLLGNFLPHVEPVDLLNKCFSDEAVHESNLCQCEGFYSRFMVA